MSTLWDTVDHSPPGSSVHGILQARILQWVAMPSSRHLPNPGTEPVSLMSPALAGGLFTTSASWEALYIPQPCSKPSTDPMAFSSGSLAWHTKVHTSWLQTASSPYILPFSSDFLNSLLVSWKLHVLSCALPCSPSDWRVLQPIPHLTNFSSDKTQFKGHQTWYCWLKKKMYNVRVMR